MRVICYVEGEKENERVRTRQNTSTYDDMRV
jgi:hypothetical protein